MCNHVSQYWIDPNFVKRNTANAQHMRRSHPAMTSFVWQPLFFAPSLTTAKELDLV
jgi:hypothetical protein